MKHVVVGHVIMERKDFLGGEFLISKMLFNKNLVYQICVLCDPYFVEKVILSIKSHKDFLCELV